jgi:hypothetical protein
MNIYQGGLTNHFIIINDLISTIKRLGIAYKMNNPNPDQHIIF